MNPSDSAVMIVAEKMRGLLRSDRYAAARSFISSRQAAQLYGVSHVTASRALRLLAQEKLLSIRSGASPAIRRSRKRPRIACFMVSDFSNLQPEKCSENQVRFQRMLTALDERNCDYEIFSQYDLQKAYYSKRILRNFDGLLVEMCYAQSDAAGIVSSFTGPKVWIWSNWPLLEDGNQLIPDYVPGLTELLTKARFYGIKKVFFHYYRDFFAHVMQTAARLSSWQENEYEFVRHSGPHSRLNSYRHALNMRVSSDELHVCEVDLTAFGFYQAFLDRGLRPGDFHVSGIGNLEARGHLPFGEACITTLGNDIDNRVKCALDILFDQIAGGTAQSLIERIPSKLIIRKSTFFK